MENSRTWFILRFVYIKSSLSEVHRHYAHHPHLGFAYCNSGMQYQVDILPQSRSDLLAGSSFVFVFSLPLSLSSPFTASILPHYHGNLGPSL